MRTEQTKCLHRPSFPHINNVQVFIALQESLLLLVSTSKKGFPTESLKKKIIFIDSLKSAKFIIAQSPQEIPFHKDIFSRNCVSLKLELKNQDK